MDEIFYPIVSGELSGHFSRRSFSHHFGCHFEFLREMQMYLSWKRCQSDFDTIFDPMCICRVICQFFSKNRFRTAESYVNFFQYSFFPPFLVAILNLFI